MPRQLQLTQNLLDRAATAWNVVYSTVSFLINFPSHFEAFVKWIDSLDPSQALASSKIGAYLLNSAARQADGAWKAAKGRALQRKGHTNPVDDERDAELLVGALRALTALPVDARRNLSRDFDQGGASRSDGVTRLDDELLVPAKPFGFLAAALNEYEPARPEVHRSRVRPDPRRSLLARMSIRGESLLRGEPVRGA